MAFLRKNYEKIGRTRLRGMLLGKGLKIHKTLDKHSVISYNSIRKVIHF